MYALFLSYSKIAPIIGLLLGTMVDSMKQIFLLQPEVLTPNRNGFMAKKRKWHLKAGSTVYNSTIDTSVTPEYKFHPLRRFCMFRTMTLYSPSFHYIKNSELNCLLYQDRI